MFKGEVIGCSRNTLDSRLTRTVDHRKIHQKLLALPIILVEITNKFTLLDYFQKLFLAIFQLQLISLLIIIKRY